MFKRGFLIASVAVLPILLGCGKPMGPGELLASRGSYAEAESALQDHLKNSESDSGTAEAMALLGYCFVMQEELDQAEAYLNDAVIALEGDGRSESAAMARVTIYRAMLAEAREDWVEVSRNYEDAHGLLTRLDATQSSEMAITLAGQGRFFGVTRDIHKATQKLEAASALFERKQKGNEIHFARCLNDMGSLLLAQGRGQQALPKYERAKKMLSKAKALETLEMVTALNGIAFVDFGGGKFKEAREGMERALALVEGLRGEDHPDVAKCYVDLAQVYHFENDDARAREYFETAIGIYENAGKEYEASLVKAQEGLARHIADMGESAE